MDLRRSILVHCVGGKPNTFYYPIEAFRFREPGRLGQCLSLFDDGWQCNRAYRSQMTEHSDVKQTQSAPPNSALVGWRISEGVILRYLVGGDRSAREKKKSVTWESEFPDQIPGNSKPRSGANAEAARLMHTATKSPDATAAPANGERGMRHIISDPTGRS
jgi:hypothetical protein